MSAWLICPTCGGGLPTRRAMRRHLETHGIERQAAFDVSNGLLRTHAPKTWRCVRCRRSFATSRGLIRHARLSPHGRATA